MVEPAPPPAEPATPTPPVFNLDSLNATSEAINRAADATSSFSKLAEGAGSAFGTLGNIISSSMVSLQNANATTSEQVRQFALLNNILFKTGESFKGLEADAPNFNSIEKQFNSVIDTMTDTDTLIGKVSATFGSAFDKNIVKGLGLEEAKKAVKDFAANTLQGADNGLKLQSIFLGLSAKTGQLGNVMNVAGKDFKDINSLLIAQSSIIQDATNATQRGSEEVEKYYVALGKVPGALNASVTSTDNSSESVSMLTATMQVASGTGRNFAEVTEDLSAAFNTYGMEGEDALKFTTRMSELSNKFNVQFSDMQKGIKDVAQSFRGLADAGEASSRMAEGAASIFNKYIGVLKQTGMTGAVATDTIQKMITNVKELSISQKAFLSGQTGGPGGLMGAFQIEKMMQSGDIKGVFEKVQTQMKQQLGSIVTLEQAASSPEAAAQLTRQIEMLKQGPLGNFAKTDTEAIRMLEGFKKAEEGGDISELSSDIVQQTMETGIEYDKKSATALSGMRGDVADIRRIMSMGFLDIVQGSFTAGTGSSELRGNSALEMRMRAATRTSGANQQAYAEGMSTQNLTAINQIGQTAINKNIENLLKTPQGLSETATNFIDTMKGTLLQEKPGMSIDDQASLYKQQLKFRRDEAASLPEDKRKEELAKIDRDEKGVNRAAEALKAAQSRMANLGRDNLMPQGPTPGADQLAAAAKQVTKQSGAAEQQGGAVGMAAGRTESAHTATVKLNVEAVCEHCKSKLETHQVDSTSPGTRAPR